MAYNKTIFLTSGTSFTVPSDWNAYSNQIACIGRGGDGFGFSGGTFGGQSGGGGAYAASTNLNLVPGSVLSIAVGVGDICFGGSTLGTCTVGAQSGSTFTDLSHPGGGQASASVGQVKFSGGNGASGGGPNDGGASGGGAAGPNGNGSNGTALNGNGSVAGGAADGGTIPGGAGGQPGNSGTEFDASHGSGSGAGVICGNPGTAANGGNYGGGGSGQQNSHFNGVSSGTGGFGLIVISYNPLSPEANLIGL